MSGASSSASTRSRRRRRWCAACRRRTPGSVFDEANVRGFLDELVGHEMAATDGTHYVGLALMPPGLRPALELASRRSASSGAGRMIPILVHAAPAAAESLHA